MNSPQQGQQVITIQPTAQTRGGHPIPTSTKASTDPNQRAAVRRFVQGVAAHNNATQAYLDAFPHITNRASARVLAYRLLATVNVKAELAKQRAKLDRLADAGIETVAELMAQRGDLQEAGRNARFVIEQAHGKATQKVESKGLFVTVNYDLTGDGKPMSHNISSATDAKSVSTKTKKTTKNPGNSTPPGPPAGNSNTPKKDNS